MAIVNLPRVPGPKPWGRHDLPPAFGNPEGRIGEIWFDDPSGDLPLLTNGCLRLKNYLFRCIPMTRKRLRRAWPAAKKNAGL